MLKAVIGLYFFAALNKPPVLVDKHYGGYLAVVNAILFDPRYGLDRTAPFPQMS